MKIFTTLILSFLLFSCSSIPEVKKDIVSPFYGDKNSSIQIKIYTDFECPACIVFEEKIGKELFEKYANNNKIGITYKMFPLNFHKNAKDDALSVLCSSKQGKFIEFSNKMYALEKEKKGKSVNFDDRLQIAKDVNLNETEFTTCVNEKHYLNKIESDIKEGNDIDKIRGTPSIFINGVLIDISKFRDIEDFFKLIDNLTGTGKTN
ncbi:MAG: thioredoxin domain-containing protein [Candidatus Gracilibacteria bacterium]|nr:thioredoxin domain-containing protein [Candidatus Gracilibacteria bacterium]